MTDLEESMDFEILKARLDIRYGVTQQLEEELDVDDTELEAFTEEDRIRASSGGKSLASSIGLAVLILLRQGDPEPVKRALSLEDYRLRRMAVTEVATSYASTHLEYQAPDGWVRRWDATLDTRVCKTCAAMDGTLEPWADDAVPGLIHPACRCVPFFIQLSQAEAA